MSGPLTRETWLDVRATAIRLGRELLGPAWSDEILNRDDETGRTVSDIRKDFYKVLSSGEVTAQIDDGSGRIPLDALMASHFAFDIDISINRVWLPEYGHPWTCMVNAHELDLFLKKYRQTRHGYQAEEQRRSACLTWLQEQMRHPKVKPKNGYRKEAMSRFGISGRAFDNVWTQAAANASSDWAKAGRMKSHRK